MVVAAKTDSIPDLIPASLVVNWNDVCTFDNSELGLADGACLPKLSENTWPESPRPAESRRGDPASRCRWPNLRFCGWLLFFDRDWRPSRNEELASLFTSELAGVGFCHRLQIAW
ncbi:MAG: hypothetical protein JW395_2867 [Nitrospira sp.]|nr:hypothetical protein [Nitrospira sp.]